MIVPVVADLPPSTNVQTDDRWLEIPPATCRNIEEITPAGRCVLAFGEYWRVLSKTLGDGDMVRLHLRREQDDL